MNLPPAEVKVRREHVWIAIALRQSPCLELICRPVVVSEPLIHRAASWLDIAVALCVRVQPLLLVKVWTLPKGVNRV